MRVIRVGSRKSKLALVQSGLVIDQLSRHFDQFSFIVRHIVTKGDRIQNVALAKVGGKGLFVKEIERSLLNGTIDFAVHSMKDMPAELPPGLEIATVPVREDPHDLLISREGGTLKTLPTGAVIGTSSLRRAAQILHERPDLSVRPLRGNVDTRLERLDAGDFDAIILASAGLKRLGIEAAGELLDFATMLPAVGQGALAIECRSSDLELKRLLLAIKHEPTSVATRAERAFLKRLNGSCQVPIAAFSRISEDGTIDIDGLVASIDGKTVLRTHQSGDQPELLGIRAADALLAQGAGNILTSLGTGRDTDDQQDD
ncbi:hydroxymethylbilane synthase [Sporolactobacillus sp. CPB3-1]|uniref:Porphobilinogen deaminase n=1 Tax=Sporolactobacillus mangiferae TaxID=2940498 RepID=A0ABT0MDE9_9BACL|nr:hydroxymethylbilane synthase [Sporolactobacillus mangiferae]MCL1632897.1 hydroxymethylbilane synthase [Sporolactobacillus mangiferae]